MIMREDLMAVTFEELREWLSLLIILTSLLFY